MYKYKIYFHQYRFAYVKETWAMEVCEISESEFERLTTNKIACFEGSGVFTLMGEIKTAVYYFK